MQKTKRSKRKLKIVKPKKKRNLKELFDQDYLASLPSDVLRDYVKKFNNEFYRGSKLYNEDSLHQDPELRKAANRNREAFDREIYLDVTANGQLPDNSSTDCDPLDALIEAYDIKYNSDDDE